MDSVIVFFGEASFDEVEREATKYGFSEGTVSRGSEHFYLWRYPEETIRAEHELDEINLLHRVLGSKISSAFQVASRHGSNARLAIQVVRSLMSSFKPSVLDDAFGNLWLPDQVAACAESDPEKGIYALRPDA
jgi:hypothetical protein